MSDTAKKNVRALRPFRILEVLDREKGKVKSKHIEKGAVISKDDFPSTSDWKNLMTMTPPRVEETSDKVAPAPKAATLPGSGK